MGSSFNKTARDLAQVLKKVSAQATSPYDTPAEVKRIEGDTAWVHIPGGVDETPVQLTTNAKKGDIVQVRVSGGRAWLYGNATAPPTDDTKANEAKKTADVADEHATNAVTSAMLAQQFADAAKEAADSAQADATIAKQVTDEITEYAETAEKSVTDILQDAEIADASAKSALAGLATLESVVDTVNWFADHRTATTDTTVVSNKNYYIYDSVTGSLTKVVPEGTENPSQEGWYELDETIQNYVVTHVAETDDGLYVVGLSNGWKVLVSSGEGDYSAGIFLIDPSNNVAQSTTASGISFDNEKPFYIGDENAYIIFNGDGQITIGGSVVMGGTETLSDILDTLNGTLIYDHDYVYTYDQSSPPKPVSATFTAHVYKGGIDISQTNYSSTDFSWYRKTEDGEVSLGTGYTKVVNLSDSGYGAEIIGKFTIPQDSVALTNEGDTITDDEDTPISVRSTGDTVRVRDLTSSSIIFDTDKFMVIGGEDEHLISMSTLQDYLNNNLDKQVLFNTTAVWNAQTTLQSEANTLYIYTDHYVDSDDNLIAGIKVGDGNAYLIDLPFTDSVILDHVSNSNIHISSEERVFWNNKVSVYYGSNETAIFTTSSIL